MNEDEKSEGQTEGQIEEEENKLIENSNETKPPKIEFNKMYKPFNFVVGYISEDKSVSCMLPPNFLNGDSKFRVSISFDGFNWSSFSDFELNVTSSDSIPLPPQRTSMVKVVNSHQQKQLKEKENAKKVKKESSGLRIAIKATCRLQCCCLLLLYHF